MRQYAKLLLINGQSARDTITRLKDYHMLENTTVSLACKIDPDTAFAWDCEDIDAPRELDLRGVVDEDYPGPLPYRMLIDADVVNIEEELELGPVNPEPGFFVVIVHGTLWGRERRADDAYVRRSLRTENDWKMLMSDRTRLYYEMRNGTLMEAMRKSLTELSKETIAKVVLLTSFADFMLVSLLQMLVKLVW
jgi:hypothetical protein